MLAIALACVEAVPRAVPWAVPRRVKRIAHNSEVFPFDLTRAGPWRALTE